MCLAIMAQSWSLSVLGWVPGIITMVVAGVLFWITSMTMHKFIMKYPQIKDICKKLLLFAPKGFVHVKGQVANASVAQQAISDITPLERARLLMNSLDSCCSPTTFS